MGTGRISTIDGSMVCTDVLYNGTNLIALVDSGCSITILKSYTNKFNEWITTMNGDVVQGERSRIKISVNGRVIVTDCVKVNQLLDGIDMIIGLNTINELGGVRIKENKAYFEMSQKTDQNEEMLIKDANLGLSLMVIIRK